MTNFPMFFRSDDEALHMFNQLGVAKKIQFKKWAVSRNEKGELMSFRLVCARKSLKKKEVLQGLELQANSYCDCPVFVGFTWHAEKNGFVRKRTSCYQHSHPLEIVSMKSFVKNEAVIREIKLYVECNL